MEISSYNRYIQNQNDKNDAYSLLLSQLASETQDRLAELNKPTFITLKKNKSDVNSDVDIISNKKYYLVEFPWANSNHAISVIQFADLCNIQALKHLAYKNEDMFSDEELEDLMNLFHKESCTSRLIEEIKNNRDQLYDIKTVHTIMHKWVF